MAAMQSLDTRPQILVAPSPHPVVALVGLAFEARIAAAPHVYVLCGKDGRDRFSHAGAHVEQSCRALVSFGVAGGVAPDLKPGDILVASSVLDAQASHRTDEDWCKKLLAALPEARHAPILGVDAPVVDPAVKRELNLRTGAAAVDMESHLVARLAVAKGLSFVAIRVVVDPADRAVPPAAIVGMKPDGTTSIGAVLSTLVAKPSQLFGLTRIAFDLHAARKALVRVRERLGHGFGLIDADGSALPVRRELGGGACALATTPAASAPTRGHVI